MTCMEQKLLRSADDHAVVDMLASHISRPDAGGESDAVFAWLYAWARSPAAPLQRFVARIAPSLAAQYLLRSSSNISSPGLEACSHVGTALVPGQRLLSCQFQNQCRPCPGYSCRPQHRLKTHNMLVTWPYPNNIPHLIVCFSTCESSFDVAATICMASFQLHRA